jgi:hypothetical protein
MMTARDVDILCALEEYQLLTSTDLQKRFFTSKSFADRRLRHLYDHRLVERIIRPVSSGKAEIIYVLGDEGRKWLILQRGYPTEERQERGRRKYPIASLEHRLAINKFRFVIEEAVRIVPGYAITQWHNTPQLIIKQERRLFPDAFIHLHTLKGQTFLFLEMDLGTETVNVFHKKLQAYHTYRERNGFESDYGVTNFRVLTVTTTKARSESFVETATGLRWKSLFWFTWEEMVCPATVFEQIWVRADRPGELVAL